MTKKSVVKRKIEILEILEISNAETVKIDTSQQRVKVKNVNVFSGRDDSLTSGQQQLGVQVDEEVGPVARHQLQVPGHRLGFGGKDGQVEVFLDVRKATNELKKMRKKKLYFCILYQ